MRLKFSNQYHRSRNRYPGRGGCLTNTQKAAIAILAREAFQKTNAERRTSNIEFQEWRRHEQFLAVGKDSLRDCVQGDYKKLLAHFLNLKGEPGRAVKAHMETELEDGAIAMRKLERECAARGLELSYPAAICKNKFKCALEDATPRQLWVLVFDVRTSKHQVISKESKKAENENKFLSSRLPERSEDPF